LKQSKVDSRSRRHAAALTTALLSPSPSQEGPFLKKPAPECFSTHHPEQALTRNHSNQSGEESKKRIETSAEIKRTGARQRPSKRNGRDRKGEAERLHKVSPVEA
jgi:hypothetical protein